MVYCPLRAGFLLGKPLKSHSIWCSRGPAVRKRTPASSFIVRDPYNMTSLITLHIRGDPQQAFVRIRKRTHLCT
jgi:hypothetical protein